MARSIAADLAPRKIRVNVVAPGATKTQIWKRAARANATAEESAKVFDFLLGRAKRCGQGCAFSCLRRFVVHQRGRANGGRRINGCSLRGAHSSRRGAECRASKIQGFKSSEK